MKWSRQHLLILYTLVVAGLVIAATIRGFHKGGVFDAERHNDFRAYYLAAEGVWSGDLVPAYHDAERPFQYPPPFAYVLAPLGGLPYRLAVAVWVVLNALLMVLVFRYLDQVLGLPLTAEAKIAGLLLTFRVIEGDFANGNANLLVLGIVLGALTFVRRGYTGAGGVTLAVACLSKVTPVILLPWIFTKRCWRQLLVFALCAVVIGGLVPFVALGPTNCLRAWKAWREGTLSVIDFRSPQYQLEPGKGYVPGQSLRALVHRFVRESDATAHDGEVKSIHVVSWSKQTADLLYFGVAGAVLLIAIAALRYRQMGHRGWSPNELAVAILLLPLLGPLSRKAHFVCLWPAAVLAFEAWWQSRGGVRTLHSLLWCVALGLVVGTSPGFIGREASTHVQAYCPLAFAALCLMTTLLDPRTHPRSPRVIRLESS